MASHMIWKTKWRWLGGTAHCFVREGKLYESLCGRHTLPKAYGGTCRRPPPMYRCGICDGKEMDLLGWDESGPDHDNWMEGCP